MASPQQHPEKQVKQNMVAEIEFYQSIEMSKYTHCLVQYDASLLVLSWN